MCVFLKHHEKGATRAYFSSSSEFVQGPGVAALPGVPAGDVLRGGPQLLVSWPRGRAMGGWGGWGTRPSGAGTFFQDPNHG